MTKTAISKLLAYVLRHNPADIGIELDVQGWTDVDLLLSQLYKRKGVWLSRLDLEELVKADKKQRYTLSGTKIRANQGHSLKGILPFDLIPIAPPDVLYHGTHKSAWSEIKRTSGLKKMNRHHVHLSADRNTADLVAQRWRGQLPVILTVDAKQMVSDGFHFFISNNGVWMTDHVPLNHIEKETR